MIILSLKRFISKKDEENAKRKRIYESTKKQAYSTLGGYKCVILNCPNDNPLGLIIDHKKACGKNRKYGLPHYQDVKKNPHKYQVMCAYHNEIKKYEDYPNGFKEELFATENYVNKLINNLIKRIKKLETKNVKEESSGLSNDRLVELLYPLRGDFVKKGKIDSSLLIIVCSQDLKHPVSRHRSYLLRRMLERQHPKLFKGDKG